MANNTPHKANDNTGKRYERTVHDPRVALFTQYYLDSVSPTFMNILQSGQRAGYSEQYSMNISTQRPLWWVKLVESSDARRARMLDVAEKNLENTLIAEPEDTTDKKIKADATKFVSERLGKEHYSTRKELTDKGGRRLFTNSTKDTADLALEDMFIAPPSNE